MSDAASRVAIGRSFGRAAASYDAACSIQPVAAKRLLRQLSAAPLSTARLSTARLALDLGCATSALAPALTQALPDCRWLGVDLAWPMLQQSKQLERTHERYLPVCADACALPLPGQSVELIFSSFALQWAQPQRVMAELQRVLVPGGWVLLAVPLPGSLAEIEQAWANVDQERHVNALPDTEAWLTAANTQDLCVLHQEAWQWREYAPDAMTQLKRIKATGAQHQLQQATGLASKRKLAAFLQAYEQQRLAEGLPLSWQVLELALKKD